MFDANQLRKGDFALVQFDGEQKAAKVIYAKAFQSIGVRFADHREKWFASRTGFGDILAGARRIDGEWKAL